MTTQRSALITGISGQDGWYLAKNLLAHGYSVLGTTHRPEFAGAFEIEGQHLQILCLDLAEMSHIEDVIRTHRPDEVYNLAARASSAQLFDDPLATAEINGVGVARLLEAIRLHSPDTKFCQASSSEIFAGAEQSPQDENTPRLPTNAYGAAKTFADHMVAAYRGSRGLFACSAILYPHESSRRPVHFLIRKVAQAAARVEAGLANVVVLGDVSAIRDWGYAPDYVEAMRRMLQSPLPRDYVIATGEPHTVAEVCEVAFAHVGLDWHRHVRVDEAFMRAPETVPRVGNPTRARAELAWDTTVSFGQLIEQMVDSDRLLLKEETKD